MFVYVQDVQWGDVQRTGLAAVLAFITFSPELKPTRITNVEDKYKSLIEFRLMDMG